MSKEPMFNKETKIFIGIMFVVIGTAFIIAAYAKKKLLKETFEQYDNEINGTEITNNKEIINNSNN